MTSQGAALGAVFPGRLLEGATGDVDAALARHGGVLAAPADVLCARVSGAAARDFLGRQLTCDLDLLAPERALLGAWLSPKGRVLAVLRLLACEPGALLLVGRDVAADTFAGLSRFVLRDDVHIAEAEAEWATLGVAGPRAGASLQRVVAQQLPARCGEALSAHDLGVLRLEGETPRYLIVAAPAALADVVMALRRDDVAPVSASAWELLEIRAGVPQITRATSDLFVPQMLNLERLDAVSFTKGCYPGQEVVARTQHLGRIKRRMLLARTLRASAAPTPGMPVHPCGDTTPCGRVVRAAPACAGGYEMLVVLALELWQARSPVCLGAADGAGLELSEPAYGLAG